MRKMIINQWYKLSIRNKQLIFFTVIIIFVSWISLYSIKGVFGFLDEFSSTLTEYYNLNGLLSQVTLNRQSAERFLKDMNSEDLQGFIKSKDIIYEYLDKVKGEAETNLEAYFLLRAIRNSLDVYFEEYSSAISGREHNIKDYYVYQYKAQRINDYTQSYIQQLLNNRLNEGTKVYNQLFRKVRDTRSVTFAAIVAMLLLCIWFAVLFSNYLTLSIRKLASASNQISRGNFNVKEVRVKSMDEVGMLADAFNRMSSSIKRMMDDLTQKSEIEKKLHEEEIKIVKMEQLLKEAEFLALQSQINPHFLFNTLNIISRMSMFEGADSTTKLIQSLSNIFRYNLGKDTKDINLAREIEIVSEYMSIQKYRFGDRIRFDMMCRVDSDKIAIPRFTLQPLIENAIIHGIEPKERGGSIRIKVLGKGSSVEIRIIDNGMGMSRQNIEALLCDEEEHREWHVTGIGITNVMGRLKLFFNCENCLKIWSKVGFGTVIILSIPLRKGDGDVVQAADS